MTSWLDDLDHDRDPHHTIRLTRHLGGEDAGWWQGFDLVKGCVVIQIDKCFSGYLTSGQTIWVWNSQENQPNLFTAQTSNGAVVVIRPPEKDELRTGRSVELFSGFGGWAMGSVLMGTKPVISVERDPLVAQAAGVQHACPVYDIKEVWSKFKSTGRIELGCIWVADVFDPKVMMMLSVIQIDHIWGSPPCQPWSSMATQAGLATVEGRYIPGTFCLGYKLGVQSINLENVKGFRTHAHYEDAMRFAERARFCRAQESVDDCTGVLPLSRPRWLGCFLSQSALVEHVSIDRIRFAREIQMPEDLFLGGMRGCDALFHTVPGSEHGALQPDKQALDRLTDAQLIPKWWKAKPTTPDETIKARTISPKGPLTGMVASYGRQHEFEYQYLLEKGLHTMVLQTNDGHRYVSPWEQVACLGFPSTTTLPSDHKLAWHILGNSLSTAHAMLQLYRAHVIFDRISPFRLTVPALPTLCRKMQRLSLRISGKTLVEKCEGFVHMVADPPNHTDSSEANESQHVPVVHEGEDTRHCKRVRVSEDVVSPTIPYHVESQRPVHSDGRGPTHDQPRIGQGIQFLPAAQDVEIDRMLVETELLNIADEEGFFRPAAIASKTSRWVQIVWGPPKVEVQSLIKFALPHVTSDRIDQIDSRGVEVQMRSVLDGNPPHIIRFRPVLVACCVCIEFASQYVIEEATVTTTVAQWIAGFCCKAQC